MLLTLPPAGHDGHAGPLEKRTLRVPRCRSALSHHKTSGGEISSRPGSAPSREESPTRKARSWRTPPGSFTRFQRIAEEPPHLKTEIFLPENLYSRYGFFFSAQPQPSDAPAEQKQGSTAQEQDEQEEAGKSNGLLGCPPEKDDEFVRLCHERAVEWMTSMGFSAVARPYSARGAQNQTRSHFEPSSRLKSQKTRKLERTRVPQIMDDNSPTSRQRAESDAAREIFNQVRQMARVTTRTKSVLEVDSPSFERILTDAKGAINGRKQRVPLKIKPASQETLAPGRRRSSLIQAGAIRRNSAGRRPRNIQFGGLPDGMTSSSSGSSFGDVGMDDEHDDGHEKEPLSPKMRRSSRASIFPSAANWDDANLFASLTTPTKKAAKNKRNKGKVAARKRDRDRRKVRFGRPSLAARLSRSSEALIRTCKFLNKGADLEGDNERFQRAFERFLTPPLQELPREKVPDVVRQLGYCMLSEEALTFVLDSVAPYTTLDSSEFIDFMAAYVEKEDAAFQELFHTFDKDGSGDISKDELMHFLVSLGFTPLQEIVEEAMMLADADQSGCLDFEQMRMVVSHYRRFEGFTRSEVAQMEAVFLGFCSEDDPDASSCLPVDKLAEVLVDIFGAAHKDLAAELQLQADSKPLAMDNLAVKVKKKDMNYQEFLQWARRLREAEIDSYRPLFRAADADGSGYIEPEELKILLKSMGLTPLQTLLQKCIAEVDKDGDGEINFEEFVNLMGTLRRTEGFDDEELYELEDVFCRFDNDNSGEIDALEIVNVMRYLGFVASLDDAHRLVSEVDANSSGAVDFREFLHLMRVWREDEIRCLQGVYEEHSDRVLRLMRFVKEEIFDALSTMGHKVDDADADKVLQSVSPDKYINNQPFCTFDRFVLIADKTRTVCTDRRARFAGLSREQISGCREMFLNYCKDDAEEISAEDLSLLLHALGCPIRTKEEQQQVVHKIDEAREAAKRAGVKEAELGSSSGKVSWWVFLQLAGWLSDEENVKRFNYELEVLEETDFTHGQVIGFHRVFEEWAKLEFMRYNSKLPKRRRRVTQFGLPDNEVEMQPGGVFQTMAKAQHRVMVADRLHLGGPMVVLGIEGVSLGLAHKLGIHLKPKERGDLAAEMAEVVKRRDGQIPPGEEALLDFPAFLYILRWMLNKNFAGIKDVLMIRQGFTPP